MNRRKFLKSVAGLAVLSFGDKVGLLRSTMAKSRTPNYQINPAWKNAPFELGFVFSDMEYAGEWSMFKTFQGDRFIFDSKKRRFKRVEPSI